MKSGIAEVNIKLFCKFNFGSYRYVRNVCIAGILKPVWFFVFVCAHRGLKILINDDKWKNILLYKCCYHDAAFRSSLLLSTSLLIAFAVERDGKGVRNKGETEMNVRKGYTKKRDTR